MERYRIIGRLPAALGLTFIGLYALLSARWGAGFAQLHFQVPFLEFPIFPGEIVFLFCLGAFLYRYIAGGIQLPREFVLLVGCYGIWILFKALEGYFVSGPYALRNAALFYYSFFAIFVFVFMIVAGGDTP